MNELQIIEHNNERILLTSQLAEGYGTTVDVITRNFNRNKERYQEGKHYYALSGDDKHEFLNLGQFDAGLKNAPTLYLWTEKGALLHAKSLGTDEAWETYEKLVDTYFKAQDMALQLTGLSPQLLLLINIEMEQKRQQAAIEQTNQRINNMQDIIRLDTTSWREDSHSLVVRIAQKWGGNEYIRDVQAETYRLVDQRAGVSLSTRLSNHRRRMAEEGVCKSKRDKVNRIDIISNDRKLIEIYTAIVKEMAVKYGVSSPRAEAAS